MVFSTSHSVLQDHYEVVIAQLENQEIDLEECPPGRTTFQVAML